MADQQPQFEPQPPTLTLEHLPAELLYEVHLYSLSPSLSQVSRHLHAVLSHSSAQHKAHFLLLAHPRSTLSHAVRYPVCTLQVVHALERITSLWRHRPTHALTCKELPRRLAKASAPPPAKGKVADSDRGAGEDRLALLRYLLDKYGSSANSRQGYFLARAVLAKDLGMIELLLAHGADPSLNKAWAVSAAIGHGDLSLVKLLMERETARPVEEAEVVEEGGGGRKKRRRESDGGGGGKRRRIEERCKATSEMLETAAKHKRWDIFEYLREKGAVPSLEVLKLL